MSCATIPVYCSLTEAKKDFITSLAKTNRKRMQHYIKPVIDDVLHKEYNISDCFDKANSIISEYIKTKPSLNNKKRVARLTVLFSQDEFNLLDNYLKTNKIQQSDFIEEVINSIIVSYNEEEQITDFLNLIDEFASMEYWSDSKKKFYKKLILDVFDNYKNKTTTVFGLDRRVIDELLDLISELSDESLKSILENAIFCHTKSEDILYTRLHYEVDREDFIETKNKAKAVSELLDNFNESKLSARRLTVNQIISEDKIEHVVEQLKQKTLDDDLKAVVKYVEKELLDLDKSELLSIYKKFKDFKFV